GTMLCFITTDCNISSEMLEKVHKASVKKTYNRVSVDGDTSTNDMCVIMANGLAQNEEITSDGEDFDKFFEALHYLNTYLARQIARDGEGSTRLITCTVKNAKTEIQGETLAKSVASSSLVKAAMFGSDANWGRVLCAMGYSGEEFDPKKVDISFCSAAGEILVCKDGTGLKFDEDKAKKILVEDEVIILADIKDGTETVTAWGCDLTYDYVKINGDYRS
ncbi:MAG: bifunctional ornithine acetyltransferase/N-acetylglutamate synthase, partial [Oscillospiraceae bacterium]